MTKNDPIFAEILALLDDGVQPPLEELEHTLTAGYAAALALEAERWRIERKLAETAALVGDDGHGKTREISKLARRLTTTDDELARLRGVLVSLRNRTSAVRAA